METYFPCRPARHTWNTCIILHCYSTWKTPNLKHVSRRLSPVMFFCGLQTFCRNKLKQSLWHLTFFTANQYFILAFQAPFPSIWLHKMGDTLCMFSMFIILSFRITVFYQETMPINWTSLLYEEMSLHISVSFLGLMENNLNRFFFLLKNQSQCYSDAFQHARHKKHWDTHYWWLLPKYLTLSITHLNHGIQHRL